MAGFLLPATRAALEQLLAADSSATEGSATVSGLDRLRAIRSANEALDTEAAILLAVRDALDDGAPWEAIADAAGLGVSAAKWRWQGSDDDISARHEAGRKRSIRPTSVPTDLPGLSVAEAAKKLGVTPQAIYLRVSRNQLEARTVTLDDGRSYKRVFLPPE